jgi:hypothetical protein
LSNSFPPVPFSRSYWVESGKLLAGAFPGSPDLDEAKEKITGLVQCGIQRIINLMEPDETGHHGDPFDPYDQIFREMGAEKGLDVSMIRRAVRDLDVPSPDLMAAIVGEIDQFIAGGLPVYVHCWGGRGRTGTVVGCWLVNRGLSGREALERIKFLRRNEAMNHKPSPEMEEQIRMVLNWRTGN